MFERFKSLAKQLKQEFDVYRLVAKHPDTPWLAKMCLGLAIGYLLLPFDLIPDFIPVLGQLDDVVIIPLLVYIALRLTPASIIASCRQQIN
ncbi:MAG: DUF1232 domain-containing protein [Betaproteobacteria bacterium]|jgi:uncharacterized membrane protein YkvA (DUF1232 family)|nr:DUF1232 domain-containing protein [Betaproteobacteria bacterium]MCH9848443.1 DUF1232 domain-containing protein [Betaproteobacteria bacterium]MDG1096302.1 YkvA family protein [Methylophilaceae bacterium]MDG1452991.1 YkvA family protein [Methylophilaceae bacterium]